MIKLTTEIEVEVLQVQATLHKKIEGHPFVALLMRAFENGGQITAAAVQRDLLEVMPEKASKNLLTRLTKEGYFQAYDYDEEIYNLTEIGWANAEDKTFWDPRTGAFKIYRTKDFPFLPELPLKVEVAHPSKDKENKGTDRLYREEVDELTSDQFRAYFKQNRDNKGPGEFRLSEIENACVRMTRKFWKFTLEISPENGTKGILNDGSGVILTINYDEIDYLDAINELFENDQSLNWDNEKQVIKVGYDPKNLSFSRIVQLSEPNLHGWIFKPTKVHEIRHIPIDIRAAQEWYEGLLIRDLKNYFFSEEDYNAFAEKISAQFNPNFNLNPFSREALIESLEGKDDQFFRLSKLTTMDYLTY